MQLCDFIARLSTTAFALAFVTSQAIAENQRDAKTALPIIKTWTGDLDGMKARRLVRILVPYSKTIYFLDKGEQLGTAAELGEAFGKWLNKGNKTELKRIHISFIPTPRDKLLAALNDGSGDIVAGNLTITPDRQKQADFSKAVANNVREILVTGPAKSEISRLEDLAGNEIYVRKSSSYYEHLVVLNEKFVAKGLAPIQIIPADENLEDEDLMEMVNAALLPHVIVDSHKADIWTKIFTRLKRHDDIFINDGGEIALAIRKNSPLLKKELDAFVEKHRVGTDFGSILRKRYYNDVKTVRRAFAPEDAKRFNEMVEIFRRYGAAYNFDHLMIAAQGYQESRLDQSIRSKSGAVGVMQIKPSTAREKAIAITGVESSAERNIHAGNKYLRYLIATYINDPSIDAKNKTLFAFAAYNAGPGSLRKFRDKARTMGLDPNVWFGNVENAAAEIIGRETVQYIGNIYKYYIAYSMAEQQLANRAKSRNAIDSK